MSLEELQEFFHYTESQEDVAKTVALLDEVDARIQHQIAELQANYQQIQRKKTLFCGDSDGLGPGAAEAGLGGFL
jgi:hypothetical protein